MTRPVHELVIYSRPGCHLCEEMKVVIQLVQRKIPFAVREVDISADANLERLYGIEIPILMIDGRKAAKYRISEEELKRKLTPRH